MIRSATLDDAPACAAILNDWIDATPWMPRVHVATDVQRHYRETVLPKQHVFVAGHPVRGYLALDKDAREITSLFVADRGQGIGKALLDHAKGLSRHLCLWTFVANEGARRFYDREGFAEVERTDGDNEEHLPDIRLEWSLM